MARPTNVVLSHEHLLHNIALIQNRIGHSRIIAMVKANAYGHGIRSVSARIAPVVHMFGVASLDEAIILRTIGLQTPIMLAEGVFEAKEWAVAAYHRCEVVIHHISQIQWLDTLEPHQRIRIWLKINTGMNRLGFFPHDIPKLYALLRHNPRIQGDIGLMSHFASSEQAHSEKTTQQSTAFRDIVGSIPDFSGPVSLCNSGGIVNRYGDFYDYVRPGLLMYGVHPYDYAMGQDFGLRPVMTLKSQLISVYTVQAGDTVGYNETYSCPELMTIGIVPIGYGDGYPLTARNGTPVRVNDTLCPLIGRVSMDMLAVDLRSCPGATVGDSITLWGENLPIETIAPFTQEHSHALLTGLHNRVRSFWTNDPHEHGCKPNEQTPSQSWNRMEI
ncbi:MAG: alanine racemase [Alphaproteobacteria bacterium]|nr:alanine racemase [Alphaproteobacteria bacterium]